jgi:hypothetical protein
MSLVYPRRARVGLLRIYASRLLHCSALGRDIRRNRLCNMQVDENITLNMSLG